MNRVCILTDSSVQFTRPDFGVDEHIIKIPIARTSSLTSSTSRKVSRNKDHFGFESPSELEIRKLFSNLRRDYSDILVITLSSALSELFSEVGKVIKQIGDAGHIQVIDSHTTSVGLGLLVQIAVNLATQGAALRDIERQLRISIPHIYTLLCLPNLSYLAAANFLSPSQAVVGEMLDLLPIFSLEDGCLTAIQKVRTQRHLLETFQEFVDEFCDPVHVVLIKNGNQLKAPVFRDYVINNFPRTVYSEQMMGVPLAELLGPQSVGLIVMDKQT